MPFKVTIKKRAEKEIEAMPLKLQARVRGAIDLLAVNPFPPKAIKLQGREGYRIKTGDYRILYNVDGDQLLILVLRVGHRKDIYR
jgi:mRNA interferase RelE/StbE